MLEQFAQHLTCYLSQKEIDLLLASLDNKRYQGLLLNPARLSRQDLLNVFPSLVPHPIIDHAFIYDPNDIAPGKSYLFNAGAYYLQDLSAMLVAHLLPTGDNEIIADLCAAPGGKTVQTALKNTHSLIIANDVSGQRARTLASNIERFGFDHVLVTNEDAINLLKKRPSDFNKIILDAPCSGSGMFRKNEDMLKDWSYQKVLKYQALQKTLILAAYQSLLPGGELIYSTCSFSYEEDEAVVAHLLKHSDAQIVEIPFHPSFYMSDDIKGAIHLFPHRFEGDGHFICHLKKPGHCPKQVLKIAKKKSFGDYQFDLDIIDVGQHFFGLKYAYKSNFHILRYGVFLGSITRGIVSYNHALALYLNASQSQKLNDIQKEKYLRGETFMCPSWPNGYQVVSYLGVNLGWVKISGGQAKNHYPKGLRRR